jgi:hypothetical protein
MIYFAQLPSGAIKIGKANDVEQRAVGLEYQFGGPVAILKTMAGGLKEEREMHGRFRHLRLRGEQFRPGPDLMGFIGRPLLVGANPDAVEAADGIKPVRLDLSEPLHRELRIEAAKQGVPMAAVVRDLVVKFLEGRRK